MPLGWFFFFFLVVVRTLIQSANGTPVGFRRLLVLGRTMVEDHGSQNVLVRLRGHTHLAPDPCLPLKGSSWGQRGTASSSGAAGHRVATIRKPGGRPPSAAWRGVQGGGQHARVGVQWSRILDQAAWWGAPAKRRRLGSARLTPHGQWPPRAARFDPGQEPGSCPPSPPH